MAEDKKEKAKLDTETKLGYLHIMTQIEINYQTKENATEALDDYFEKKGQEQKQFQSYGNIPFFGNEIYGHDSSIEKSFEEKSFEIEFDSSQKKILDEFIDEYEPIHERIHGLASKLKDKGAIYKTLTLVTSFPTVSSINKERRLIKKKFLKKLGFF